MRLAFIAFALCSTLSTATYAAVAPAVPQGPVAFNTVTVQNKTDMVWTAMYVCLTPLVSDNCHQVEMDTEAVQPGTNISVSFDDNRCNFDLLVWTFFGDYLRVPVNICHGQSEVAITDSQ